MIYDGIAFRSRVVQIDILRECVLEPIVRFIKISFVPPRSPDLNPVERFWSWLRRELRHRDLHDLHAKRPVLGKMAYRRRVRGIMKTKKAKLVATNITKGFKKVCKKVVEKQGAHSGK